jgi:hypothetical protein
MESKFSFIKISLLLAAGALMAGCGANKNLQSTEVPTQSPSNAEMGKTALAASGRYTVVRHDTLWAIAGKNRIYGDHFQWPLIFKANRDEIQDPDLIYPRQIFRIEKGVSLEERQQAKQLAMETPKYVPHSTPRAALPINYF